MRVVTQSSAALCIVASAAFTPASMAWFQSSSQLALTPTL